MKLKTFYLRAQFFGLNNLEADMQGSQMHQQLLAAYRKVGAHKLS